MAAVSKYRGRIILGLIICIAAGAAGAGTAAVILSRMPRAKPGSPGPRIAVDSVAPYLQNGDIILRRGNQIWSRYFKDVSQVDKRFSHAGIVRVYADGRITIINSESDKVNEVDLPAFLEPALAIGIFRTVGVDGALISDAAFDLLDIPFDWEFDLSTTDKLYCTELLYAVLAAAAPHLQIKTLPIEQIGRSIIPLDAFSHSPDFTEIFVVE